MVIEGYPPFSTHYQSLSISSTQPFSGSPGTAPRLRSHAATTQLAFEDRTKQAGLAAPEAIRPQMETGGSDRDLTAVSGG